MIDDGISGISTILGVVKWESSCKRKSLYRVVGVSLLYKWRGKGRHQLKVYQWKGGTKLRTTKLNTVELEIANVINVTKAEDN